MNLSQLRAVISHVLSQRLAPLFLKPLAADAAHDLREESGKRHVGGPGPAPG